MKMAKGMPLADPIPWERSSSEADRLDTGFTVLIAVLILTVKQIAKFCQQTGVGECSRTARPPVAPLPTADRRQRNADGLGYISLTELGAQTQFQSLAGFGPETQLGELYCSLNGCL
jgi:hypothetical protein